MRRRCRALIQVPNGRVEVKCAAGEDSQRMEALYRELLRIVTWTAMVTPSEVSVLTDELAAINQRRRDTVAQRGGAS